LGQCYVAVDPKFFPEGFQERLSELTSQLRELPPASDSENVSNNSSTSTSSHHVLIHGDPEREARSRHEKDGIPLHQNLVNALAQLAIRLNVAMFPTI